MWEPLEQAIRDLSDARAGWVVRRDAAEALGKAAQQALACLQSHRKDKDQDVQRAVEDALRSLHLGDIPPAPENRTYTIEEMVQACEKKGKRVVEAQGDGYAIHVKLAGGRSQTVHVKPYSRSDGTQLIRIHTLCGEATEKVIHWALRGNSKLPHCAFALHKRDDKEWIILVYNLDRDRATPEELSTAVKAIAHYGDWFEKRLSGQDEF